MIVQPIGEQQVTQRSGRGGVDDVAVEGSFAVRRVGEDAGACLYCGVLIAELDGREVESLVAAEGSAKGSAKLFAIKARHGLRTIKRCGESLQMPVALEEEGGSVHLISAGARDDVDDAVAGASHLRGESSGGNLELRDGVLWKI